MKTGRPGTRPARKTADRVKRPARTNAALHLGRCIRSGFSDAEIPELLARLILTLDQQSIERFADSLDPERGKTLRDVLAAGVSRPKVTGKPKTAPGAPVGPGRARQEWEKAWTDWDLVIAESNNEHGEYVHQEHHWEAPYFCPGEVADALEPIAERMRPLIPKLVEARFDPEFSFLETLKESLDETAAGLDDWMGAWEGDGMGYGPEVTTCLFEAEWAWTRRRNGDLAEVVERIQEFEATNKKAGFDDHAAVTFLMAVPHEELLALTKKVARGPAEKRSRWWRTVCGQVQPKQGGRSKGTVRASSKGGAK